MSILQTPQGIAQVQAFIATLVHELRKGIAELTVLDRASNGTANIPGRLPPVPAGLAAVGEALRLSVPETEVLALAIAGHLDDQVPLLYGMLSGLNRPAHVTRDVLSFFTPASAGFAECRYRSLLVESGDALELGLLTRSGDEIRPAADLMSHLAGRDVLPACFRGCATLLVGRGVDPILDNTTMLRLERLREVIGHRPWPPIVVLVGDRGTGHTTVARSLARARSESLIEVDVPGSGEVLPREVEREAIWRQAAVLLKLDDRGLPPVWERSLAQLLESPVTWLVSCPTVPAVLERASRPMLRLDLCRPDAGTRRRLWQRMLPPRLRAPGLNDDDLAFRFRGTPREIDVLARQAIEWAAIEEDSATRPEVRIEHLNDLARRQVVNGLTQAGELESALPSGLAALVLPDHQMDQLADVIRRVRHRQRVIDAWGFARGTTGALGTAVLLSGPPGTGKTHAARALAAELGVMLYRIDVSRLVSKWLGETEKHLAQIFDAAEASGAALLFDEADSLFGQRTEMKSSNDRYANLEVNYLLQRLERFSGVCFLTTNLVNSIDQAFIRRMSAHIQFALPGPDERLKLWQSALPDRAPLDSHVDLGRLAAELGELSGAEIANAALRAAYIAADEGLPITQSMLRYAAYIERKAAGGLVREPPRPECWSDELAA